MFGAQGSMNMMTQLMIQNLSQCQISENRDSPYNRVLQNCVVYEDLYPCRTSIRFGMIHTTRFDYAYLPPTCPGLATTATTWKSRCIGENHMPQPNEVPRRDIA
jgi:hypothetical protein